MPSLNRILYLLKHPDELRARMERGKRDRILAASYRKWRRNHGEKLEQFRNIHQGEKCFIIGNGPSLNQMDLNLLNDHICFGLNKIHLLFERTGLSINYHVAVNPLVIEQSFDKFVELECPSFLSFNARQKQAKSVGNLFYLFSTTPFTFSREIRMGIHEGYTVTYVAMQIAYFMGFKEVYLIGVDHNFSVDGEPNEKQFMDGPDPNHFDPNYFSNHEWQLPDLQGSELAYRMAQFFYLRDNREIFDATVGGKLEVFRKITFEEALNRCGASNDAFLKK
jgi:hypothetical protein